MTMIAVRSFEILTPEQEIRNVIDRWADALRSRDLDSLMALYAPDAVFFDGIAPLQITGDAYRKNWEEYFAWFPGPVDFGTRNMKITVGGNAAFFSALVYLKGTNAEGRAEGAWMRETVGYERRAGRWLIIHEHWSLPVDMESGKAATDLKPE
jgi:uncharacterized protein (TIGR02246 family)